jgi:putative transposase
MLKIADNDPAGENPQSVLDDLVHEGARRMLAAALNMEVETYIQSHAGEVDADGRRVVVRNGYSSTREVKTGAGPIEVRQPRVNDRRSIQSPVNDTSSLRRFCLRGRGVHQK